MLLWMGGSRRKVTTQQQTAVLDSHADPKEHRSLDVLSLLNLSTTAEERKCACLNEISVFDLLADDGPSGNLEASPVHEAHVAFSVEGIKLLH
ncbi:hypothetical protein CISIN_1g036920mg [Citrus sinensis]|uniref:Uncharacterized protein n=1 Tax=Citrus sinensis TaxID=2711 RepID=A0A067DX93_CITSI|nr:hypothetical protein CISIN_1g036920mg [Citrus sinensis]